MIKLEIVGKKDLLGYTIPKMKWILHWWQIQFLYVVSNVRSNGPHTHTYV